MIKRGVSLKHLDAGAPQLSGKIYKIAAPAPFDIKKSRGKLSFELMKDCEEN
jgi:uncharacterized protein YajQ (UPF0234 family)